MANLSAAAFHHPPFATSETEATSVYRGPFGYTFSDPSNPLNVYMLVDCQEAFVIGEAVAIAADGTASQVTSSSKGLLGFITATVSGSDTAAFAQIEGSVDFAILTSGVTTAALLYAPATTDGGYLDILTTTDANVAAGATCTAAPSTATTPFTSDTQASALVGVGTVLLRRGGANFQGVAVSGGLSS